MITSSHLNFCSSPISLKSVLGDDLPHATANLSSDLNSEKFREGIAVKILNHIGDEFKAHKNLDLIKSTENFNWNQFALTLPTGIIRNTELEGGRIDNPVSAALNFVSVLIECDAPYFEINFNSTGRQATLMKLQVCLKKYQEYIEMQLDIFRNRSHQQLFPIFARNFLKKIQADLEKHNSIYIPLHYTGDAGFQGHAISCKITKDNDVLIVTLFNLGRGAHNHPILNYSFNYHLRSFASFPLRINETDFYGPAGEAAIVTLIRYMVDLPNGTNYYDCDDLYDIFKVLSLPTEQMSSFNLPRSLNEYEAKEQIVGNCTQVAIDMVMEDFLIENDVNREQREIFFLNRDLILLIQGFKQGQSCKFSGLEKIQLINDACGSFALKIIKLGEAKQINQNEVSCCEIVLNHILSEINRHPRRVVHLQNNSRNSAKFITNFPTEYPVPPSFKKAVPHQENSFKIEPNIFDPPCFQADTFEEIKATFESWLKKAQTLSKNITFSYVEACVKTLPIPLNHRNSLNNSQKDFWHRIPPSHCLPLIKLLRELLQTGLKTIQIPGLTLKYEDKLGFVAQFMTIYTTYAVVDKLARINGETTGLEGFDSPFIPFIHEKIPTEFSCLPLAEDNRRYSLLFQYFTSKINPVDHQTHGKPIFPSKSVLNVSQYVNDYIKEKGDSECVQGKNHIEFLFKHIKRIFSDEKLMTLPDKEREVLFGEYWYSCLPEEVQHLYYLSFLSNLLVSCPNQSYPEKLDFTFIPNSTTDVTLTIQAPYDSIKKNAYINYSNHPFCSFETNKMVFDELRSPEIKKMGSNEAICFRASTELQKSWGLFEPDIRTILYLTRHENISLFATLEEFSKAENLHLLSNPGLQNLLDTILFHPHYLIERMNAEPDNLSLRFRSFVSRGLEFFEDNPKHFWTILYLIEKGICFETFTNNDEKRLSILGKYQEKIDLLRKKPINDLERYSLDTLSVLIKIYNEFDLNESYLTELFSMLFDSKYNFNQFLYKNKNWAFKYLSNPWIIKTVSNSIKDVALKFSNYFQEKAIRNQICTEILKKVLKKTNKYENDLNQLGDWEGSFPQYTSGIFTIDLFQGCIIHKKLGVLCVSFDFMKQLSSVTGHEDELFSELVWNQSGIILTTVNLSHCWNLVTSVSYSYEDRPTHNADKCQQHVNILPLEADTNLQAFLEYGERLPWLYYSNNNGVITVFDKKRESPYMRAEVVNNNLVYTRTDENGKILPYKLINVSKLNSKDLFYYYTACFTYPDKVLCFVEETNKQIEELNFFTLKLFFQRDENGLASAEHPGYYLIATTCDLDGFAGSEEEYQKIQKKINGYKGIFTLYNPSIKTWKLLFPEHDLVQKPGLFSGSVQLAPEPQTCSYQTISLTSYIYAAEIDELICSPPSDCSLLKLVNLFKMQRDYKNSINYLKKISTSINLDDSSIKQAVVDLIKIEDYSASSLAFNLHYFLFLFDGLTANTEGNISKDRLKSNHQSGNGQFIEQLMEFGRESYRYFIRQADEYHSASVPDFLTLQESHKKRIVLHFHNFYERNDKELIKLDPVIGNQYKTFFHPSRKQELNLLKQHISLSPAGYELIKLKNALEINLNEIKSFLLSTCGPEQLDIKYSKQDVDLPQNPIRVGKYALIRHFSELFEEARKLDANQLDPFDFKILALTKVNNYGSLSSNLLSFIFFVRYFSYLFKGEEYSLKNIQEMRDEELQIKQAKLKESLQRIEYESQYPDFQKMIKRELVFEKNETIILSCRKQEEFHHQVTLLPIENKNIIELNQEIEETLKFPFKLAESNQTTCSREDLNRYRLNQVKQNIKREDEDSIYSLNEKLMKEVILKNDLNDFFRDKQAIFSLKSMHYICSLVNQWYYQQVLQKLARDKIPFADYDYLKYPEISYFYMKTGKFPTQKQIEIYKWICEGLSVKRNRHFQFAAGGGKTDVITPLLNLAAKRMGLMPVTCVTQSIYSVDKNNLKFNLSIINEDLAYLEIGMHMIKSLNSRNLKEIYTQLLSSKSVGRSLIITKNAYDSIHLIRDLACKGISFGTDKNDSDFEGGNKIRWAQNLLNFFKNECLLICDESHQNADPITRAIFGTGDFVALPANESAHLLNLMLPLVGVGPEKVCLDDGRDVSLVSNFGSIDAQGSPSVPEVSEIQKHLANHYWENYFAKLAGFSQREAFLDYWTNRKADQPEVLRSWGASNVCAEQELASQAALTGHFLLVLLPDAMKLRTEIDHARSIYPEKKFDVPCRNKFPTTAEFEAYKTAVITIKGTYQRGLLPLDIRKILEDMLRQNEYEKTNGLRSEHTITNQRLNDWLRGSSLDLKKIEDLEFHNQPVFNSLVSHLSKNTDVIKYFLIKYCFPFIGNPSEQLFSTTTDLFAGFKHVVAFSATPRETLAYPRSLSEDDYLTDDLFSQNVHDQLLKIENGSCIAVESHRSFFESFSDERFMKAAVLIDPRGFFSPLSNHEVAQNWLNANPSLEGVLFCKEERSEQIDRSENFCLLKKDGSLIELQGSDIVQALKRQGLDWHAMHLGTLFDPARTESANILQKEGAAALFCVGDGLTKTHLIQAVMRMRGFLDKNQTVAWVIPKGLASKISPHNKELNVAQILEWADQNGMESEETRIVLNAFQEIYHEIAKQARAELIQAHQRASGVKGSNMEGVQQIYEKYKKGFSEPVPASAYEAFGNHEVRSKTEQALLDYAAKLNRRFGYGLSITDPNHPCINEIRSIIQNVKTRIEFIYSAQTKAVNAQVEHQQEIRLQIETQQENQVPRPMQVSPEGIEYGNCGVSTPDYWNFIFSQANKFYVSDFLSPRLTFGTSQKVTGTANGITITKPINYLFLVMKGDQWFAHCGSNDINWAELTSLMKCPGKDSEELENLEHSACMISSSGIVIQKGERALKPDENVLRKILDSVDFKDVIIDVALLKGEIVEEDRLLERIREKGWENFQDLWTKIINGLPCAERANVRAVSALKERYLGL